MAEFDCPVISGTAFSARRMGSRPDAISFRIEMRAWEGVSEAACRVRIKNDGEVLVDRDLFGLDPLQALESAIQLVRRFAVMVEPDEAYITGIAK